MNCEILLIINYMEPNFEIFHCVLIFNNQQEPILSIYDEYFYETVISPSRRRFENNVESISIENVLMQLFSPIIASQSAMLETIKMKFSSIDLFNDQTLVFQRMYNCSLIILLTGKCQFRLHPSIIQKKLELIEWLICSFYGVCWNQMKFNNDKWLKILLREMWLMDKTEFNLTFWSIERIDLSSRLKLNERVLEVLISNSKYLRQVNEKQLKHQLILVGSKLFSLFTNSESPNNLKTKDNLLFVLICNVIFNRFSRAREQPFTDNTSISEVRFDKEMIRSISKDNKIRAMRESSSSSTEFSSAEAEFPEIVKTMSTTVRLSDSLRTNSIDSASSVRDFEPFVMWIENKDGHKYRIVRVFLQIGNGLLTPCHLHLIKMARNVIYVGVEEDLENHVLIPTLDKSIRLLRKLVFECEKTADLISTLKFRIGHAIDKLHYLGAIHAQQLRQTLRIVLSRNSNNSFMLERLVKELLKTFELIYCEYYISHPITVNEKLCKSFLRCFLSVRKEMSDFLAILSMKALRNMSPTSFYPLYPGMVHFIVKTRKLQNSLICPVIDQDFLSDHKIQRLHILVDICQQIGSQLELSTTWRHIEICDNYFRCTYLRRKYKVVEDKYEEFELTVFHLSQVSYSLVKKQMSLLMKQFLSDHRDSDAPLLDLMS